MKISKKIQPIRQMEYSECGLASILMILNYNGHQQNLTSFREKYPCPRGGFSLFELYRIAEMENLKPEAFRVTLENIPKSVMPCILHYSEGHYVVLESKNKKKFKIVDPAFGRVKLSIEELKTKYSGAILTFKLNDDFSPVINNKKAYFSSYLKNNKGKLFAVTFLSLVFQFVLIAIPILTKNITDFVVSNQSTHFLNYFINLVLFFLCFFIVKLVRGFLITNVEIAIDYMMMSEFMSKLIRLPYTFFSNRSNSDILMRTNSGTLLRDVLTNNIIAVFIDLIMLFSYSVLLMTYSVELTLLLLIISVALIVIMCIKTSIIKKKIDDNLTDRIEVQKVLTETVYNIMDLKTLGVEDDFLDKWELKYKNELKSSKDIGIIRNVGDTIISSIRVVVPMLILLLGYRLVQNESISVGVLFAFNIAAVAFIDPILSISQNISLIISLDIHFKRTKDVLESKSENYECENVSEYIIDKLEFENVAFKYNIFGNKVIQDLNFNVNRGESIAIVGESGSGKSTILKMILGIYSPTEGEIKINGVNMNCINLNSLRTSIGTVLQESKLFTGTIRENIVMNRIIPEEDLVEACSNAQILKDILKTPLKFDTMISEQGSNFSGGERQRLLIARALINNPQLIVFDEATSSLDRRTETQLFNKLNDLKCTKVIVAHRLSTIKNADKIICIKDSKIVEIGSHSSLMNRKGVYWAMYSLEEKKVEASEVLSSF